eukprot:g4549.t1
MDSSRAGEPSTDCADCVRVRTSKPEKSVPRPREDIERVEENPRPFEDEDKAYRAAAEAAAERALERDRNSDWWKKLQAQTKPSPVARCERLPIHRDPTGKRKTCPLPTRGFKVLVEADQRGPSSELIECLDRADAELRNASAGLASVGSQLEALRQVAAGDAGPQPEVGACGSGSLVQEP